MMGDFEFDTEIIDISGGRQTGVVGQDG